MTRRQRAAALAAEVAAAKNLPSFEGEYTDGRGYPFELAAVEGGYRMTFRDALNRARSVVVEAVQAQRVVAVAQITGAAR